jgi:hypothetical protein
LAERQSASISERSIRGKKCKYNTNKQPYWWSDTIEKAAKEKRAVYNKWLATGDTEDSKTYIRNKNSVKKIVKEQKNIFWNRKCDEVDSEIGGSKARSPWKVIKSLRQNTRHTVGMDPIGLTKWKKHYKELLTENRDEYKNVNYEIMQEDLEAIETITVKEVKETLRMKNHKALGPGGIPTELLKCTPQITLEYVTELFNDCLFGEENPEEWKLALISSLHKRGSSKECGNYRGISVLASIGKLYGRIINQRIEWEIKESEEQSSFRPGRSTIDNIFCLKQIAEKKLACGKEAHFIFIDLRKAYDSVPLNKLQTAMERNGVSTVYINDVKRLYKNTRSCIRIKNQISQSFIVTKGLCQGCCISPTLFKIFPNEALKNWIRKCKYMGININEGYVYTLLFADDQIITGEDEDDMNYMMRKLTEEYNNWGLEINFDKTQYMVVGGQGQDIITDHGTIKTSQYKYLGVSLTSDRRDDKDICNKIVQGKKIIRQLHSLLWNHTISKNTKQRIFK